MEDNIANEIFVKGLEDQLHKAIVCGQEESFYDNLEKSINHKYYRREPKAGGGFHYYYSEAEYQSKKASFAPASWPMPEGLDGKDRADLAWVETLYNQEDWSMALKEAQNLDTIVRDAIPENVWQALREKAASSDSKHISDMSKKEKIATALKFGIKNAMQLSSKELDKRLVEENVDRQLATFKERNKK